ncbi:MAG: NADP-dependent isocitrate dehydrogenase, partial [Vibrio cyclitrophicus]
DNNKSPSRRVGELDNRGSHYYLAAYWAKALAEQTADADLAAEFAGVASQLAESEEAIVAELNNAQGVAGDLGGYYLLDDALVSTLMRPSSTLNAFIDA